MKARIATFLVIFVFGLSSMGLAGNVGPEKANKTSKRAVRNISMLQEELNDPYRDSVDVIQKKFKNSRQYKQRNGNYKMLLEELE